MKLREAIQQVQELGRKHDFAIVIVGGAMVRLIDEKTTIKKIDVQKRMIFLQHARDPQTIRPEDKQTVIDIDCIAFSLSADPFIKDTKQKFTQLKQDLHSLQKQQKDFPAISLEPVLYHPPYFLPNQLFQFVSSIEAYSEHNFLFRLSGVTQEVSTTSLATWTYTFTENNQEIISLNPLALQLRYNIRGFSIKPKDKEKIFGNSPFNLFVKEFNKQTSNLLEKEYISWHTFAQKIATSKSPSVQFKKTLWKTYWQTIGTYLAHGSGFVGKVLLPLGNTFFAGK